MFFIAVSRTIHPVNRFLYPQPLKPNTDKALRNLHKIGYILYIKVFYNPEGGEIPMKYVSSTIKTGISFGSALAMVVSYANWHSIPWAIFHGILGWFYVVYYAIFH